MAAQMVQVDFLDEAVRQELGRVQANLSCGKLDADWAIRRIRKWLGSKRRADDEALYIDWGVGPHCCRAVVRLTVVALPDCVWLDVGLVAPEGSLLGPVVGRLFVYEALCANRDILQSWVRYVLGKYGLVFPWPGVFDGLRLVRGVRAATVCVDRRSLDGCRFWFCTRYAYWGVRGWIDEYRYAVKFLCDHLNVSSEVAARILIGDLAADEVQAEVALGGLAR